MIFTNGKFFLRLAVVSFLGGMLIGPFLSGCADVKPYWKAGAGYAAESGNYFTEDRAGYFEELDEKCAIGYLELGAEFDYGVEAFVSHSSCFSGGPEISSNHFLITKKGYFE